MIGSNRITLDRQTLDEHFADSFDPVLHAPYSVGDVLCRCGACGSIIRAELLDSSGMCPSDLKHFFIPAPVIQAGESGLRLTHNSSRAARTAQPQQVRQTPRVSQTQQTPHIHLTRQRAAAAPRRRWALLACMFAAAAIILCLIAGADTAHLETALGRLTSAVGSRLEALGNALSAVLQGMLSALLGTLYHIASALGNALEKLAGLIIRLAESEPSGWLRF